jgi:hypothetical protein
MVGFCAAKRVLVEQQVLVEVEQQQSERRREFARCRLLRTTAYGEQAELAKFAAKFAKQVRQAGSPSRFAKQVRQGKIHDARRLF